MSRQRQQNQQPRTPAVPFTAVTANVTNEARLRRLEQLLNHSYIFKDGFLALEALQIEDSNLSLHGKTRRVPNRKRLALVGDRVLDLHLCLVWFQTGTTRLNFSQRRDFVASNKYLAEIGQAQGLDACIVGRPNPSHVTGVRSMATTVEAILGAVYLDAENQEKGSGMDVVTKVIAALGIHF